MMYKLNIDYSDRKYCYAQKNLAFGGYTFGKCPSCGRQIAKEQPKTQQDAFILEGGKKYPDFLKILKSPCACLRILLLWCKITP